MNLSNKLIREHIKLSIVACFLFIFYLEASIQISGPWHTLVFGSERGKIIPPWFHVLTPTPSLPVRICCAFLACVGGTVLCSTQCISGNFFQLPSTLVICSDSYLTICLNKYLSEQISDRYLSL